MDREEWKILVKAIRQAERQVQRIYRPLKLHYRDWLIVAMYLWAVSHDRPQSWACDRKHYNSVFRPRKLPSISQFNRRLNEPRTVELLQRVHQRVGGQVTATALSYLDGKPLTVGVASKDPDAKTGYVMGGFAKGYKLHAWMSEDRRIPLWSVMPLNVAEQPVAEALIEQVQELSVRSLVLADQNYDTHDLHKAVDGRGGRLLVQPKGKVGPRHPVTMRQMGAARRELIAVQEHQPVLLRLVLRERIHAEGTLGNLVSYGGGLTGLPAWVRRLPRVRRWVGGKIILYHARLRARALRKTSA